MRSGPDGAARPARGGDVGGRCTVESRGVIATSAQTSSFFCVRFLGSLRVVNLKSRRHVRGLLLRGDQNRRAAAAGVLVTDPYIHTTGGKSSKN